MVEVRVRCESGSLDTRTRKGDQYTQQNPAGSVISSPDPDPGVHHEDESKGQRIVADCDQKLIADQNQRSVERELESGQHLQGALQPRR